MRTPFQVGSLLLHPKWRPFEILLWLGLWFLILLHCYLYHICLHWQEGRHLLLGQCFPLAQCLFRTRNWGAFQPYPWLFLVGQFFDELQSFISWVSWALIIPGGSCGLWVDIVKCCPVCGLLYSLLDSVWNSWCIQGHCIKVICDGPQSDCSLHLMSCIHQQNRN